MVLTALSVAGAVDYLVRQADENPAAFMTLIGKFITKGIDAKVDGVTINWPLPRTALDG